MPNPLEEMQRRQLADRLTGSAQRTGAFGGQFNPTLPMGAPGQGPSASVNMQSRVNDEEQLKQMLYRPPARGGIDVNAIRQQLGLGGDMGQRLPPLQEIAATVEEDPEVKLENSKDRLRAGRYAPGSKLPSGTQVSDKGGKITLTGGGQKSPEYSRSMERQRAQTQEIINRQKMQKERGAARLQERAMERMQGLARAGDPRAIEILQLLNQGPQDELTQMAIKLHNAVRMGQMDPKNAHAILAGEVERRNTQAQYDAYGKMQGQPGGQPPNPQTAPGPQLPEAFAPPASSGPVPNPYKQTFPPAGRPPLPNQPRQVPTIRKDGKKPGEWGEHIPAGMFS